MRAEDGAEEARQDGLEEIEKTPEESAEDALRPGQRQHLALLTKLEGAERLRLESQEPDALRRDRIVDQASDLLLRRVLRGDPPKRPRAWLRRIVDRLIQSRQIPHAAKHLRLDLIGDIALAPESEDPQKQRRRWEQATWLRRNLKKLGLSERESAIFRAALDHSSNSAAAKALGMNPSNFRRDLGTVVEWIGPRICAEFDKNTRVLDLPPPLKG